MPTVREIFDAFELPWPDPDPELGGSAFVDVFEISAKPQNEIRHYLPPSPPSEYDTVYDVEGNAVFSYKRSESEMKVLFELYEKAAKEYERTRGTVVVKTGPTIYEALFGLANGLRVRGVYPDKGTGRSWVWTEWWVPR